MTAVKVEYIVHLLNGYHIRGSNVLLFGKYKY